MYRICIINIIATYFLKAKDEALAVVKRKEDLIDNFATLFAPERSAGI